MQVLVSPKLHTVTTITFCFTQSLNAYFASLEHQYLQKFGGLSHAELSSQDASASERGVTEGGGGQGGVGRSGVQLPGSFCAVTSATCTLNWYLTHAPSNSRRHARRFCVGWEINDRFAYSVYRL